jgi:hypothetical protein
MAAKKVSKKFEALGLGVEKAKVSRSFYIEEDVWEEFQRQCKAAGQSASEVVATLVKKFVEAE